MDRKEELEKMADKHLRDRYSSNISLIKEYYRMHRDQIQQQYLDKISEGLELCERQNKKLVYIVNSMLYSSNLTKSYELQIAFFDEKMYFDESPVYIYWSPEFIFSQLESDMDFFKKKASQKVVRIKAQETDNIFNKYILNYYFQVVILLKNIVPDVLEKEFKRYNWLSEDIMVLFGRYMERPMLIYQRRVDENEIFSD